MLFCSNLRLAIFPYKHKPTIELNIVQLTNRTRGTFSSCKLNDAATFGAPVRFGPHISSHHISNFTANILEVLPLYAPSQISYEDTCAAAAAAATSRSSRSSSSATGTTAGVSAGTAAVSASTTATELAAATTATEST